MGLGWRHILRPALHDRGPVLLIVLVVLLIRWLSASGESPKVRIRTAREILDERFAKGEIQRDEYEERRKTLAT
jgi:putative membrane protein